MKNPILILIAIIFLSLSLNTQAQTQFDTVGSQTHVKIYPQFPGDRKALYNYIFHGTKKILDTVNHYEMGYFLLANVIIETNGSIKYVKIIEHTHPQLESATVSLLKTTPKWTPGYDNSGKPVRTEMSLYLNFANILAGNEPMTVEERDGYTNGYYFDEKGPDNNDPNRIHNSYERQATFPGGFAKFFQYIKNSKKQLSKKYLKNTGKVFVVFIVERDGSLTNIKIPQEHSDIIKKEIVRLLNKSPKWLPAFEFGVPVRSSFFFQIPLGDN